jgi:hypothetical protein
MGACFRIGVSAADPQLRNTDSGSSERCPLGRFPTESLWQWDTTVSTSSIPLIKFWTNIPSCADRMSPR